jgi:hypothetical protein
MGRLMVNNVDDTILREFKSRIIKKYGTLRGHFGEETTKALKLWIEREKD